MGQAEFLKLLYDSIQQLQSNKSPSPREIAMVLSSIGNFYPNIPQTIKLNKLRDLIKEKFHNIQWDIENNTPLGKVPPTKSSCLSTLESISEFVNRRFTTSEPKKRPFNQLQSASSNHLQRSNATPNFQFGNEANSSYWKPNQGGLTLKSRGEKERKQRVLQETISHILTTLQDLRKGPSTTDIDTLEEIDVALLSGSSIPTIYPPQMRDTKSKFNVMKFSEDDWQNRRGMLGSSKALYDRKKFQNENSMDIRGSLESNERSVFDLNPHIQQVFANGRQFTRHPHPLTLRDRLLHQDFSWCTYKSRRGEAKTTDHWGQRKLLMSEIEFLTFYARFFIQFQSNQTFLFSIFCRKGSIVVYAGAAPGTHTNFLSLLFPEVKFLLVDPANFDAWETDKIEIINGCFTDEMAEDLGRRSTSSSSTIHEIKREDLNETEEEFDFDDISHLLGDDDEKTENDEMTKIQPPLKKKRVHDSSTIETTDSMQRHKDNESPRKFEDNGDLKCNDSPHSFSEDQVLRGHVSGGDNLDILFISDIRSTEDSMSDQLKEERVSLDMNMQKNWHLRTKCRASMLKFRLPYLDPKKSENGGLSDEEKFTEYLDGIIFLPVWGPRTTTETRLVATGDKMTRWDNKLYEDQMFYFNIHFRTVYFPHTLQENGGEGLDHCFDCASEAFILEHYLRNLHQFSDPSKIKSAVIFLSKEISRCIGTSRKTLK